MTPWGKSVSIDLYGCNKATIISKKKIVEFVVLLCRLLKVKRYGNIQVVHYGSGKVEGYSMVQLIETSIISGHFANKTSSAYIDIFSCKKFSSKKVLIFCKNYFNSHNSTMNIQYRL